MALELIKYWRSMCAPSILKALLSEQEEELETFDADHKNNFRGNVNVQHPGGVITDEMHEEEVTNFGTAVEEGRYSFLRD